MSFKSYNYKPAQDSKHLRIFLRALDSAGLLTNLHSFIMPDDYRWVGAKRDACDACKIYLVSFFDVLPSISIQPDLILWKRSWRYLAHQIYDYASGIDNNIVGKYWNDDPQYIVDNLSQFLPLPESMAMAQASLSAKLSQCISLRSQQQIDINFIIHALRDFQLEQYQTITVFADFQASSTALLIAKSFPDWYFVVTNPWLKESDLNDLAESNNITVNIFPTFQAMPSYLDYRVLDSLLPASLNVVTSQGIPERNSIDRIFLSSRKL
jgi:hypothetical protein